MTWKSFPYEISYEISYENCLQTPPQDLLFIMKWYHHEKIYVFTNIRAWFIIQPVT